MFLTGFLAGFHFTADALFGAGYLVHLGLSRVAELADVTQSTESLVEVLGGEDEAQSVVMAAVFVGEDNHLGVFFLQFAEVGIECLDVALALVDFLVEDGNLLIVSLDEFLSLLDFLIQNRDFVEGHLLVLGGLFQQLVGGRNLLLQRGDFTLQLLFRLAFRLLTIDRVDKCQHQQNQYDM